MKTVKQFIFSLILQRLLLYLNIGIMVFCFANGHLFSGWFNVLVVLILTYFDLELQIIQYKTRIAIESQNNFFVEFTEKIMKS